MEDRTLRPRSYACTFCRRGFPSAQALGGHMNIHRRDRALLLETSPGNYPTPPAAAFPSPMPPVDGDSIDSASELSPRLDSAFLNANSPLNPSDLHATGSGSSLTLGEFSSSKQMASDSTAMDGTSDRGAWNSDDRSEGIRQRQYWLSSGEDTKGSEIGNTDRKQSAPILNLEMDDTPDDNLDLELRLGGKPKDKGCRS